MARHFFTLLLCAFVLFSCKDNKSTIEQQDFSAFSNSFLEAYWKENPVSAAFNGYYKYDSVLPIPNKSHFERQVKFSDSMLNVMKKFDLKTLSAADQIDFRMIENELKGTIWKIKESKDYQWNPAYYNIAGQFSIMLTENYDTLDERLRRLAIKLKSVPAYYEAAKINIKQPTLEHTQLAIQQNKGGINLFQKELPAALNQSGLSAEEKQEISKSAEEATKAINDYITFLSQLKNEQPRSFRLGSELYEKKFEYNVESRYSVNEIFKKAIDRKAYLHGKMTELSDSLWTKYYPQAPKPTDSLLMIKKVIEAISVDHVRPEEFQEAIKKQIPELEKFVNDKNLLYLDPTKPLIVREEPDYMAGVAGASISAPGPYDKGGNTYYNVGSFSGWSKEDAESYLREYNNYTLQILNIHEAIPGHYTQLVYSNTSPSIIKSVFGNSPMIEGWAVYTELMMLENGYGNNIPELWLMYYKWNLRSVCNTILDIGIHTKNWTEEEVMHLLINEAFQEEAEAKGKWTRATLTSVQLCSYFTGFAEIYDLREEIKQKLGDKFDLKAFHEKFLSYGSAPVKYIRQLMLADIDAK